MSDSGGREVLPIPHREHVGLTTYDAKDPDTAYPPLEPLRPPDGAPNVLIVLLDDVGFAASSAFGGPIDTPTADRLAANGLKYNRFHTTALCAPTRAALLTGRNHHSVGMGTITELSTSAPGYNSASTEHEGAARRDRQAQRVLHGAVREVPRGPGVADEPDGAVRRMADGERVRALLRIHRRRDQPVRAGDLPRHGAGRARPDARGGLSLHRGHDRPRDRLGPSAEGVDVRQAVLHVLRTRCDPRASSRPEGVGRQVPREVRRRLGRPPRAHVRETEGARGDPRRTRSSRRDTTRSRHGTTCPTT